MIYFVDLNLILGECACLVKTHDFEMCPFNCLLRVGAKDIFPLKANKTEGVDDIKVDGTGGWNGECQDK